MVIDKSSHPSGYAFFRMFLEDSDGVTIGAAQDATGGGGNTLTGGSEVDTYHLGWSAGRTADTITDFAARPVGLPTVTDSRPTPSTSLD